MFAECVSVWVRDWYVISWWVCGSVDVWFVSGECVSVRRESKWEWVLSEKVISECWLSDCVLNAY